MSKIELYMRPMAVFDAKNKDHRRYYWEFLSQGSWKNCPFRFVVAEDHGHLIGHIQRELLEFYMAKDFVAKKPQTLVRQKRKKTVDN